MNYQITVLMPAAPLHLPASQQVEYPPACPRASWTREHLLDVAAAAEADSWDLVGHRELVEAICHDYGAIADQTERDTAMILDLDRRLVEMTEIAQSANRDHRAATDRERAIQQQLDAAIAAIADLQARLLDATFRRVVPAVTGQTYDGVAAATAPEVDALDDTVVIAFDEMEGVA